MIQVSSLNKIAKYQATMNLIDAGAGNGKIQFFGGVRFGIDASLSETVLAEIILTKPSGIIDESGLHLTPAADGQILITGVITWARVIDSEGVAVFSGDVLAATDPNVALADFVLDQTNVFSGALIILLSATLQEGG